MSSVRAISREIPRGCYALRGKNTKSEVQLVTELVTGIGAKSISGSVERHAYGTLMVQRKRKQGADPRFPDREGQEDIAPTACQSREIVRARQLFYYLAFTHAKSEHTENAEFLFPDGNIKSLRCGASRAYSFVHECMEKAAPVIERYKIAGGAYDNAVIEALRDINFESYKLGSLNTYPDEFLHKVLWMVNAVKRAQAMLAHIRARHPLPTTPDTLSHYRSPLAYMTRPQIEEYVGMRI